MIGAGAVAVLLLLASPVAATPVAASAPPLDPLTVTMTTVNDGHPVSLLDADHPGYAHLAPTGPATEVTVTVQLHGELVHRWSTRLDTPDSSAASSAGCHGEEEAPPQQISCVFRVAALRGLNRLQFSFSGDDGRLTTSAQGVVIGGAVDWHAGWEVLDASGSWVAAPADGRIELPTTVPSALRYVVTNSGGIPFRVTDGCRTSTVEPGGQLVCLVRGVRPAASLAGRYLADLHLRDAVGGTVDSELSAVAVDAFAGRFTLRESSAVVGQSLHVTVTGLPAGNAPVGSGGGFPLVFRLDDEPVLVGTTLSRGGTARLVFPLPSTSPGTAHLRVEHDGIAIASIPFDVTLVPRPPDAAPPVWPWLLAAGVLLAFVTVPALLARRRRRRRGRTAAASDVGDMMSA